MIDVDEPVPNYVAWRGGVFGIDLCDRPDMFVESAREGQRLLYAAPGRWDTRAALYVVCPLCK